MKHRLIETFVVVAMSLVFGTGPAAAAETLQLTCEAREPTGTAYSGTIKVQIDIDRQIIQLVGPTGAVVASTTDRLLNASAPSVQISDAAIQWRLANTIGVIFDGLLNRETGDIRTMWFGPRGTYANAPLEMQFFNGRCRRSTQKF